MRSRPPPAGPPPTPPSPRRAPPWPALPLACGTAISTLLFFMARDPALWAAFSGFFPFALRPVFHDLAITLQHIHDAARGFDPLSDPASDFAYPRAVLLLQHLEVHRLPVEWLGLAQGLALTAAVVLVLRPRTPRRAFGTSLLFFTPPFLLGFERANLDFPLFVVCAAAAWHWARAGRRRTLIWPIATAIGAAVVKLYPFFALAGGALAETGRARILWLAGIAAVAAYWSANVDELALIFAKLPVSTGAAWGSLVAFARVDRFVAARADIFPLLVELNWSLVGLAFYGTAALLAALVGVRLSPHFARLRVPRFEWACFWIGALICAGSFLGANLAYRWVFAILTLPLLLRALRTSDAVVARWARFALAALLLSLVAPLDAERAIFAAFHAINWSCVLLLIVGGSGLRTTAKSPVGAFLLRHLCTRPRFRAPAPPELAGPPAVEPARALSR